MVPVRIKLYPLPSDYWDPKILEDLGNYVGKFIKVSEQTKIQCYTSYAQICVYMDLSKELLEAIKMTWEDEEWMQTLYYKHTPFRCHRCHEHGHLFQD